MDESEQPRPRVERDVQAALPPQKVDRSPDAHPLAELVRGLALGDREALSSLYDQTSAVVYSLALRILRSEPDAEEVTLDVYSRAWRKAVEYDARRGSVLAWLTMMTRTMAIDRVRSNRARSAGSTDPLDAALFPVSAEPSPEQLGVLAQRRDRVNSALGQLPRDQRVVLEVTYFGGLSQTEAAERLAIPLGTVKTRVRLGMARLRQLLEGMG